MKFKYHKVLLPERLDYFGWSILKPIIPVGVVANGKELNYAALIDSGADFCIFDADIGEYLGLDVESGEYIEFGGVQGDGSAKAFLHHVTLNVGGFIYKTKIGFSYDIARHGFGILGQKGFFDAFAVKFDLKKEEIELREAK